MSKFKVIETIDTPSRMPGVLGAIIGVIIFSFAIVYVFAGSLFMFIPIDRIGVKKKEFGPSAGLVEKDYPPGYHFGPGFWCTWYTLPSSVQSLDMLRQSPERVDRRFRKSYSKITNSRGEIKIKTTEGYDVSVDVTIKYRIKENNGWKVIRILPNSLKRIEILTQNCKTLCNEVLGQLATEDFFNPDKRVQMSKILEERIKKGFDERGFILINVLIRDFQFDPVYEDKIKEKKLADQDVELNKSQTLAAEFEGETKKVKAETRALVAAIQEQGSKEIRILKADNDFKIQKLRSEAGKSAIEIQSDADLYSETLRAKSRLLVEGAKAQVVRMRNEALQTDGAENHVALEIIKNINFTNFKLSSQRFNPLEVDKVLKGFTGR
ncbi:SPFH domain-containing protein [Candidatus Riflebacteria bacterium]